MTWWQHDGNKKLKIIWAKLLNICNKHELNGISLFFSCWFLFLQLFWEVLWRILAQIYHPSYPAWNGISFWGGKLSIPTHLVATQCPTLANSTCKNHRTKLENKHVFSSPKTHQHVRCSSNSPTQKFLLKDPKPRKTKTGVFENPGIVDEIFIPTEISYFHGRFLPKKHLSRWWFQPIWKILVKMDHFPK